MSRGSSANEPLGLQRPKRLGRSSSARLVLKRTKPPPRSIAEGGHIMSCTVPSLLWRVGGGGAFQCLPAEPKAPVPMEGEGAGSSAEFCFGFQAIE